MNALFANWLSLSADSISFSFHGPIEKHDSDFLIAFSIPHTYERGGVSISSSFRNYLVSTATNSEVGRTSDFDEGFLSVMFSDFVDVLLSPMIPGVQPRSDTENMNKAKIEQSDVYVFIFEHLTRRDLIYLHLPTCTINSCKTKSLGPAVPLYFNLIAAYIPLSLEGFRTLGVGDLLIPNHAIDVGDLKKDYEFAQLCVNSKTYLNVELSTEDEKWKCTFLEEEIAMESLTQEFLEHAEIEVEVLVGSLKIPLRDLSSIQPGYVLELEKKVHEGVELRANGKIFANGELVNVDGRLGVRVVGMK